MADWRLKAVVQRTLHHMPGGSRMNYMLQRYVTRTAVLREGFAQSKLEQCGRHVSHWAPSRPAAAPDRVLEIGTGWFPFVIVGLALIGCRDVVTVDRAPLLRPENIAATLRFVDQAILDGWFTEARSDVALERREIVRRLAGRRTVPAEALADLGIRVVVGDAAALPFDADSVDLFVSNNTLEHIPESTLRAVFSEFRRVARGSARMSHFIDMSDHYSHFDRSISPLNFLRFDDRAWRRWDNGIVPQNRLRLSDYQRIHDATGWAVLHADATLADEACLDVVPIAKNFRGYRRADLRTTHAWVVSAPA